MVWKFHRFSNAVLQEVYPNYKDYCLNVNSQLSLYNLSENDTQDDIIGSRMNPVDKLGKYIAYVGKLLAVQILEEAEEMKPQFYDLDLGQKLPNGRLNPQQRKMYEDYWMENLRQ